MRHAFVEYLKTQEKSFRISETIAMLYDHNRKNTYTTEYNEHAGLDAVRYNCAYNIPIIKIHTLHRIEKQLKITIKRFVTSLRFCYSP